MGTNWMTGLMTGLAQGVSNQLLQQREQEIQQERDQMSVIKSLIANEQWDVIPYLDPKMKKMAKITPEFEAGIKPLADMQRQAKIDRAEGIKAQTEANRMALEESKRKQEAFKKLTPEQQTEADFPSVGKAQDRDEDRKFKEKQLASLEADRVRNDKLAEQKFELSKSELKMHEQTALWNHTDRLAKLQADQSQFEVQLEQKKLMAEEQLSIKEQRIEMAKVKQAEGEYNKTRQAAEQVSKRIDEIKKQAPRDPKTKEPDLLYKTEAEAKAMADRLTKAQGDLEKHEAKLAQMSGIEPSEQAVYTVIPEVTDKFDLGTGIRDTRQYRVIPVTKASLDAQASGAASGSEAPKAGGFEHLLAKPGGESKATVGESRSTPKDEPSSGSAKLGAAVEKSDRTLSVPRDRSSFSKQLEAVAKSKDEPDDYKARQLLIKSGIDSKVAAKIVREKLYDTVIENFKTVNEMRRKEGGVGF